MLAGFNTNVPFKGQTYHVQTEDSGEKTATVTTLLYLQGTIMARKSFSYIELVSGEGWKPKVAEMMKKQHISMIRDLLSGSYAPSKE